MSNLPRIPPELINPIIGSALDSDRRSDSAFALVASNWRRHVNSYRFKSVDVGKSTKRMQRLADLLRYPWVVGEGVVENIKSVLCDIHFKKSPNASERDLKRDAISCILMKLSHHTLLSGAPLELFLASAMYAFDDPARIDGVWSPKVQEALYTLCCKSRLHTLHLRRRSIVLTSFLCDTNVTVLYLETIKFRNDYKEDVNTVVLPNVRRLHMENGSSFPENFMDPSRNVLPALQNLMCSFPCTDLFPILSMCGSQLSNIRISEYPLDDEILSVDHQWPTRMQALQCLHLVTGPFRMDIPKSGLFAHLDKYLPATLPPLLCLTVEIQQYYVTFANRDVIDTSTSLNDILRLLKNHFDEFYSPFLMKLLHKRSRGSGTLVKLSLIILHYPSLSTQILVDKCTINRELREGMDLLNAGEHIFPGCNVEVELRIIQ